MAKNDLGKTVEVEQEDVVLLPEYIYGIDVGSQFQRILSRMAQEAGYDPGESFKYKIVVEPKE